MDSIAPTLFPLGIVVFIAGDKCLVPGDSWLAEMFGVSSLAIAVGDSDLEPPYVTLAKPQPAPAED